MWSLRLIFELDNWPFASFVTLTYDGENVPKDYSLHPEELKVFLEAVRYRLKLQGRKFRYYACGEYGDDNTNSPVDEKTGEKIKHGRPHFHLIMFGLNPDPYDDENEDRQLIEDCWSKCDKYRFKWNPKGDNGIDFVNRIDISYVTGYVQKKLKGQGGKELYGDRVPPFSRASQKLGLNYFLKHKDLFLSRGYCNLNDHKVGIPRYFREKIGVENLALIKPKSKKQFEEEQRSFFEQYKDWCFVKGYDFNDSKFFSWFFNSHEWDLTKRVEKDFAYKRFIKGGKL